MNQYITKFEKMVRLRNLTEKTLKCYSSYLKKYLNYLDVNLEAQPEDVTWDELRDYIFYLADVTKISPRTINGHIAQLRFFYLYVLNKQWDHYQIPYQKFDRYVPEVLTQRETMEFIGSIENLKQKAVISLMYSSGLRASEVSMLCYSDISREKMNITIRAGKNRSGSIAILSKNALDILTEYWLAFGRPTEWLFTGTKKGSHIAKETVRKYIKDHLRHLGWNKNVSSHCFRRAFGTHLFQNKVDIITIQKLMRHKNINSTAAYIYLAVTGTGELVSPFDMIAGAGV
jgi:site-specific recombinase XerD